MKLFNIFKERESVKDNFLRNAHDKYDNSIIENAMWNNIVDEINKSKRAGKYSCYIANSTWKYIPQYIIQQLLDKDYDIRYSLYKGDCTVYIEIMWNEKTNGTVFSEKIDDTINHYRSKTTIDEMYEEIENAISSYRGE